MYSKHEDRKKKVFLIGYFGYISNQLDGQTVKTRNVEEVLKTKYIVDFYDTENLKYNKFSILKLIVSLFKYDKFFFIGGENNLKYFFPILFFISLLRKSEIVYIVVGGWLYDFLKTNVCFYTYMLKRVNAVLVETDYLRENLKKIGIYNVAWIPNFRILPRRKNIYHLKNNNEFKIVFMARIMEEKGIYLLFSLIEHYLKDSSNYSKKLSVSFYGPINPKDNVKFKDLIKKYEAYVSYNGILDPVEIYNVIPRYDVLILPTYYAGEGFPGTILDSYLCGIPVIATKWKQIPEFVVDGKTGFLIDYDINHLAERVQQLVNDSVLLDNMSHNAYEKSKEYSAEIGLDILERSMKL